ncbi:MAG: autotransporter assembly complex protein TamA, partial [Gammaproteobacteria bacterium]|nr:autotransporter assembly complex protein TamA [Gammaproteobacteria bacterium]
MRLSRFVAAAVAVSLPFAVARAEVRIEGIGGALRDNVRAHLTLDDASCDTPSWRLRRLRRKAEGEIREALEAFGHYDPTISVEHSVTAKCWLSVFRIGKGEPVRLRDVDVTIEGDAQSEPAFRRLLQRSPLEAGAILDHAEYESYKKKITDLARREGYFAGRFSEARIGVYPPEYAADVTLRFASGPRYRFGAVTLEQSMLEPELLERFVPFREGDPYDGALIDEFYDALLATGYFASVDLRTQPGVLPDDTVPVSVQLAPADRKVYTAGIGYGTDTGPKLRGGFINRRVNERGHQLESSLSVSRVVSEAGVSYRIPRQDPRVEWLSIDTGYQEQDTDTSETRIYKIGLKEFRRRSHGWIETRLLDLSTERFEIAGDRRRELLLIPGLSWNRKFPQAATIMRPERGYSLAFKLRGTASWLGSDSEFLQADAIGRMVVPAWTGARLLLRGDFGTTAKDEFRSLPASVRYFAGGDNSVRGYDFETLGPTDDDGNVVGGSHQLIGSVELDQLIASNWSVAAFADTGNAFDSFSSVRTKTGVGAGLRWYSPLGPVRLDLAFPLDKDA